MNKLVFALLLLLVSLSAASTVIVLQQRRELKDVRQELAVAKSSVSTTLARETDLEQRAQIAERLAEQLQIRLSQIPVPVEKAAGNHATTTAADSAIGKVPRSDVADPNAPPSSGEEELARLSNLHFSGKIQRQYGALFKQLNLSAEKVAALTQLLIDKKQAATDLAAASAKQGQDPTNDSDAFADLVSATKSDVEDQIKALLGNDGYAAYRAFGQSTGRTNVVTQLRESLVNAGAPLTEAQANQLNGVLEQNSVGHLNQKIVNQSKSYLSPQQLTVLEMQLKEQQAAAKLRNLPPPSLQAPVPAPHG